MIETRNVSKSYFGVSVLEGISFTADTGAVCGLIGYNGAGKTTLLRVISGMYRPETGEALLDGEAVYENAEKKSRTFMLTEDMYFPPQASLDDMRDFYAGYYPAWDEGTFASLCAAFRLDRTQKIGSFSKGMRRQAGIILAFSTKPRYLLLDEIFDGLDLSMRGVMNTLLADYVKTSNATAIVTSHNLRELEDNIDKIVMIHGRRLGYVGPVAEIKAAHGTLEQYFLSERDIDDAAFAGIFGPERNGGAAEVQT
ncbi:MAG: ABC transporter ATP-binding protein [Clostridiales Family XIII bacterium]|jgi:ABC-2 type transport system ATP-binding protein|nr:ABC transporter ATP-binding protein [Clostridiales Family XIII bacterium]